MRLVFNPLAIRGSYDEAEGAAVSLRLAETALAEICRWPGYEPTPLRSLDRMARELGLGTILYKDESARFDQGSFKTLGGAYAASRLLTVLPNPGSATLCCATDGNHGRAVAYAAQRFRCRCVIFMHEHAPAAKAATISSMGAEVIRIPGTYDDSVEYARKAARESGWLLIPDTSNDPADMTTRRVMQGYGVMALEIAKQIGDGPLPTHVFLQGGVGGFAAGIAGVFADAYGAQRPTVVVVEPEAAACLFESAVRFEPSRAPGDLRTAMEMLSAGQASAVAWPILKRRADVFMTIDDDRAVGLAQQLTSPSGNDVQLNVGVSGIAGLAGLVELMQHAELARLVGLGPSSDVLVFGTEASFGRAARVGRPSEVLA